MRKIDLRGRGFLQCLEAAGVLASSQRTGAVDRIAALDELEAGGEQVNLIVLMVLWSREQARDALLPDEFLAAERPGALH
jgi:Smg protein